MVDAPVSGAEPGAIAGELVFMAGGSPAAVARAMPLLEIMGKKVFHLGPIGCGHAMKCINNLITAMTFMATAEGCALGKKFGLDPSVMTDVLNVSTGMSWISQTHIQQRIINRKFDDAFKLELMVKDIGIAMDLAAEMNLPLPLSGLGQHLWKAADRQAGPGRSISEMVRWVESTTGVTITTQKTGRYNGEERMKQKAYHRIGIIGTGMMGTSLAVLTTGHGYPTHHICALS